MWGAPAKLRENLQKLLSRTTSSTVPREPPPSASSNVPVGSAVGGGHYRALASGAELLDLARIVQ